MAVCGLVPAGAAVVVAALLVRASARERTGARLAWVAR
jgi:hypothetical protein